MVDGPSSQQNDKASDTRSGGDPANQPIRLAVLLSGGGRTLQNLADQINANLLMAQIQLVIASKPQAYGLIRAEKLGLKYEVVRRKDFDATSSFSERIFKLVRDSGADLVCLAGFMCLLEIPDDFAGRVINIHPALLPSFGGQGMYGDRVHEAVLAAGSKVSGCTAHFCDNTYDTGPIILQRTCPVLEGDTQETLGARVFEQECLAYPEAIALVASGKRSIGDQETEIKSS